MKTRSAVNLLSVFYGVDQIPLSNRNRNSFLFRVASAAGENRNIMIQETLAGKILNREDVK